MIKRDLLIIVWLVLGLIIMVINLYAGISYVISAYVWDYTNTLSQFKGCSILKSSHPKRLKK